MKVRLIQAAWETFTGNFGGIPFENGVSVNTVTKQEASRVANIVKCELLDGSNPSSSQAAIDSKCTPMTIERGPAPPPKPVTYTRDMLEQIAGEKGIKGLRAVGDGLGVKASGIADLITAILKAQAPAPAETEPVKSEAPAETAAAAE
jgi:hypothetical protein